MFIKQMSVGTMNVCCYLIGCESTKKGAIIDPGGEEDRVLKAVKKEGFDIEYIINTHGHLDHVCGNEKIKEATGAQIIMHEDDAEFFNRDEVRNFFSVLGLKESPPVDKTVKDGDFIEIGEVKLKVIHTPGHTPGGVCLYNAPDLFTGDTLFVGGVGRTDFPGGETATLVKAINEKLLTLPADTIVWPGHGYGGDSSTIGTEKKSNPFLTGAF
jgi:hydroxyacylglutathione hydrolase